MAALEIVIHGAAGRMGQRLVALAHEDPELRLAAAMERSGHPRLGEDAGAVAGIGPIGVELVDRPPARADVVIDFSMPAGAVAMAEQCAERGWPLVLATTGLSEEQQARVDAAAERTAVLQAPNMSLAVNLLMDLTAEAAAALKNHPSGVDVEIIERHHRYKEDAPSGTALRFGEIVAEQMGQTRHQHGRSGRPGARPRDEIGYHAVRVGDHPGEHAIIFGLLGESIELIVRATSRDCYAQGALAAARFLVGKGPGRYTMHDVLRRSADA